MTNPERGELYWVDWSPGRGSEQEGLRPALIVQTDAGNRNPSYPNTIVATLSTKGRDVIPTHVPIAPNEENGLPAASWVKCEQILTISKERLKDRLGKLSAGQMEAVETALKRVLDLN